MTQNEMQTICTTEYRRVIHGRFVWLKNTDEKMRKESHWHRFMSKHSICISPPHLSSMVNHHAAWHTKPFPHCGQELRCASIITKLNKSCWRNSPSGSVNQTCNVGQYFSAVSFSENIFHTWRERFNLSTTLDLLQSIKLSHTQLP